MKWIANDAEKFLDRIDVYVLSESKNGARVEKWEEANCYEQDYFTKEDAKSVTFKTFKRTTLAEWEDNNQYADYAWNLN